MAESKKPALSTRRPSSSNGVERSLRELQGGTTRLNVDLDTDLHTRLKMHSVRQKEDMSVLIRRWITEKLDEEEKRS